MYTIDFYNILRAVEGIEINVFNKYSKIFNIVTNDSKVTKNCVFVALVGKNFDGHQFVKNAIKKGALFAITERKINNFPQIVVKSTSKAFLKLAALNRSFFSEKLVAITGSVGKTTTKDMLAQILNSKFKTLKTFENLNNEIGVSQTLLKLNNKFKAAVVEMGMSNLKEISNLSKAATPNIGIITNIGVSHLKYLKTKENILKAKLEILDGMKKNSPLILNGDDEYLKKIAIKDSNIIFCGIKNKLNTYSAKNIEQNNNITTFSLYKKDKFLENIVLPTIGEHNILNSLLAIAASEFFKIPIKDVAYSLKTFTPSSMRQNMCKINGIIAIADYYNSSPDSVIAAINTIKKVSSNGKKIIVLGDMLELGSYCKKAHFKIGQFAAESKLDIILSFGINAKNIFLGAQDYVKNFNENCLIKHFTEKEEIVSFLKKTIKKDDVILFKASRKMNFEEIFNSVFSI